MGNDLDPEKCGWYNYQDKLEPSTYEGPVAPAKMLKTVLCKCKKSDCKSGNCSCHSFGLGCSEFCECDDNCGNRDPIVTNDEDLIEAEDVDDPDIED